MKRFGLKLRMTVAINAVVLLAIGCLIVLQSYQSFGLARKEAYGKGEEMAHRYANQVDAELTGALDAARTVAQTFEGMKLAWVDDRSLLNSILKQVVTANTDFAATWSCWEPDALD